MNENNQTETETETETEIETIDQLPPIERPFSFTAGTLHSLPGPRLFNKAPFVELDPACEVERAYEGDAGYDAFARVASVVRPGEVTRVPLGIVPLMPAGWFCMVQEKSGLALQGVQSIGNVIDEGYRGEISAILVNHGKKTLHFKKGTKVCQLVPMQRYVEDAEEKLPQRKGRGFGSSGLDRFNGGVFNA